MSGRVTYAFSSCALFSFVRGEWMTRSISERAMEFQMGSVSRRQSTRANVALISLSTSQQESTPKTTHKNRKATRKENQQLIYEANLKRVQKLKSLRDQKVPLVSVRVNMPYKVGAIESHTHYLHPGVKEGSGGGIFAARVKKSRVFLSPESCRSIETFRTVIRNELLELFPSLETDVHYGKVLSSSDAFELRDVDTNALISSDFELSSALQIPDVIDTSDLDNLLAAPRSILLVPREELKAPVPPQLPETLQNIEKISRQAEHSLQSKLQVISFYRFVDIKYPETTMRQLRISWTPYGVRGRIYVATEGINAQFALPVENVDAFCAAISSPFDESSFETDADKYYAMPKEIRGVFLNKDTQVTYEDSAFVDLRIKARDKVLQDGLDDSVIEMLDWNGPNGNEMDASDWHKELIKKRNGESNPVVLDCRNRYESEVGLFEGAVALNTDTFRDTWSWLEDELKDTDKDAPIMTYCTGGIRCVKVGAYLEQKMGFRNVHRLAGGIVSYSRMLRESNADGENESLFKGVNFVFDLRIGERLSGDILTRCDSCGTPCDLQTDCANPRCTRPFNKRLFIQCAECASKALGCCTDACRQELIESKHDHSPVTKTSSDSESESVARLVDNQWTATEPHAREYPEEMSFQSGLEVELLQKVMEYTCNHLASRAHMISGELQGQLLHALCKMSNSQNVLELGTFSGYSALCIASALPSNGRLITVELDEELAKAAQSFFHESAHKSKIQVINSSASDALRELVDQQFDLVFLDANKQCYREYYETILNDSIVRIGGWILADNVLFRGEVERYSAQENALSKLHTNSNESANLRESIRSQRSRSMKYAGKLARSLHEFNAFVRDDPRTEQVLLPIRDGITIIRRLF